MRRVIVRVLDLGKAPDAYIAMRRGYRAG